MDITAVGDVTLGWGESLVWDDERGRLYFVDCAASTLHWLDDGDDTLNTVTLPSMCAGIVPTDREGVLVGALDDGLYVIDPDAGATELLAAYPEQLGGRCNDMCADTGGNLITGKLNIGPAEGSAWRYEAAGDRWTLIDPDISNTNGPQVGVIDGVTTLVIGDSSTHYYRYDYDPTTGAVGDRSIFGNMDDVDGVADGTTLDADGGLWCALYDGSQLVRFTTDGLDRTIPLPVKDPTDVTFGGPDLDRLYVVSLGPLLVVDGLGTTGRPEPRFTLP